VTNHHDPLEAWLSQDVELLPPREGTFHRVRRRARRRKAVQAMSVAAAAAVVVAAAASLPQLAGNLLSRPSTGPDRVGTGKASPTSHATKPSATASAHPSAGVSSPTGVPLAAAGSGPRPAANFQPTSVTFVGRHFGAVLGQGGKACAKGLCTAIAGTADYGLRWTAMAAPPTEAPEGSSGVSQIRFLNLRDGWAYGPALYVTHDGGERWSQSRALRGRIIDLAAMNGRVFAVASRCSGQGRAWASGCTSFALYSANAGSHRWRAVPGASGTGSVAPGAIQLSGSSGYLLAGHRIYAGPLTPGSWHVVTVGLGASPPCLRTASQNLALIAPNGTDLYLACAASPSAIAAAGGTGSATLYLSADGGRSWQRRGTVKTHGVATSLAVSPAGVLVLGTMTGIWWSPDAIAWHRASLGGRAPRDGFTFVGMTIAGKGVAVPTDWALHSVFITRDGGRNWTRSPITR